MSTQSRASTVCLKRGGGIRLTLRRQKFVDFVCACALPTYDAVYLFFCVVRLGLIRALLMVVKPNLLGLKVKLRVHGCVTCLSSDTYPKFRHATRPERIYKVKQC